MREVARSLHSRDRSEQSCRAQAPMHTGPPAADKTAGVGIIQAPLVLRPARGASFFRFSSAAGIIWPNIELSIAVGIRPALLLSLPCAPDIRNWRTRGWLSP